MVLRRIWQGQKRLAKKLNPWYFKVSRYKEILDYLVSSKPGDLVHTCTGFNVKVAHLDFTWISTPGGRTRVIHEVVVTDSTGAIHHFPGCVTLPQTREDIEDYFKSWDTEGGRELIDKWGLKGILIWLARLNEGKHIVDVNGLELKTDTECGDGNET